MSVSVTVRLRVVNSRPISSSSKYLPSMTTPYSFDKLCLRWTSSHGSASGKPTVALTVGRHLGRDAGERFRLAQGRSRKVSSCLQKTVAQLSIAVSRLARATARPVLQLARRNSRYAHTQTTSSAVFEQLLISGHT